MDEDEVKDMTGGREFHSLFESLAAYESFQLTREPVSDDVYSMPLGDLENSFWPFSFPQDEGESPSEGNESLSLHLSPPHASGRSSASFPDIFFICAVPRCQFRSLDWQGIVQHRLSTHGRVTLSLEKCFCPICRRVFGRRDIRDRHFRTHTRFKKLYCPSCSTPTFFNRKDSYIRHRRKIHREVEGSVTPCCTKDHQSSDAVWMPEYG
jgi:hypothetical protein